MKLCLAALAFGSVAAIAAPSTSQPTFSKDVAPIIFNRCTECHRTGEVAPMAFTNYKEVRPWAKAIKAAVASRKMPVWLADPHYGSFKNDRTLPQSDIDTIVKWVDAGAPEGSQKDLPKMPEFEAGWQMGKPDMIIDMGADFEVPAEGVVPYKYFKVPTGFTEDKWIQAAEVRPGNRKATHHIIVFVDDAGKSGVNAGEFSNLLTGYAPGEQPLHFADGTAKLVRAGSTLRFQNHYTPNGKAYTDRSYVGLYFAKQPVKYQAISGSALQFNLKIPAGDPNYEAKAAWTAKQDTEITGLMPHMHVRGKDFKFTITYPDGKQEVLLDVPHYDFNWQLQYEFTNYLKVPKGSRIDCVAHYDNSANNKYNPDPTKEVRWGDQTFQEMMIGFFTYVVPVNGKTETGTRGVE